MILIDFDSASIGYDDTRYLEDFTWRVARGESWAITGPVGSGKSLIVDVLRRRIRVTRGRFAARIEKNRIQFISDRMTAAILRPRGMFYQARWNSIMDDASETVADYLRTKQAAAGSGLSEDHAFSMERVIRRTGIMPLMAKRLGQLSCGEIKKTVLAGALINRPDLLIFENPLAGLDRQFRGKMTGILDWVMQGIPVILITHDSRLLPGPVTHVLVMDRYKKVACGPVNEVIRPGLGKPAYSGQPAAVELTDRSADTQILVEMNNIRVAYGSRTILGGINWTIRKGEHWSLTGPNGSGKTTLLNMISADHPQAYANDITLFGRKRGSGESIWDIKQKIGMISPELHLYHPGHLSLFDTVCSGFTDTIGVVRACTPRQMDAAHEWISCLGLEKYKTRPFRELSAGEQRMGLIARSLVKEPLLLLMDEPCQGLDPKNTARILDLITRMVSRSESTLIYVSHVPEEIPACILHHMILDWGRPAG